MSLVGEVEVQPQVTAVLAAVVQEGIEQELACLSPQEQLIRLRLAQVVQEDQTHHHM